MEDLIWKFLDGECTQEEKDKISLLLVQDTEFKALYNKLMHLHQSLSTNSMAVMSAPFKLKLIHQIENELSSQAVIEKPILSNGWILSLALIAVSAISITLLFPTQSNPQLDWQIPIQQTTLLYAIWSMIGFLTLFLVDQIISKPINIRKQMYSMV